MKKTKLIAAIISACLCVIMVIVAGTQLYKVSKSDICVVNKISVTSRVTNVFSQKYDSTVSGRIKNITSKSFTNITIIVNVKTNTLGHTGTLEIEIPTLNSNGEYQINQVFETNDNFESVSSVKYRVNGNTYNMPNGKEFNGISLLFMALAVVFLVVAIYLFKSSRDVVQVIESHPKTHEEILGEIITKQQENESKRIDLEAQRLDIESKKLENERPVYCSYCGAKNEGSAMKCHNCGGRLFKQ